jgi:hypothetical protein
MGKANRRLFAPSLEREMHPNRMAASESLFMEPSRATGHWFRNELMQRGDSERDAHCYRFSVEIVWMGIS